MSTQVADFQYHTEPSVLLVHNIFLFLWCCFDRYRYNISPRSMPYV